MNNKRIFNAFTFAVFEINILIMCIFCNDSNVNNGENSNKNDFTIINDTMTDADGNIYTTVIIGNQEWMAENLRTTKFNDGTEIPMASDSYDSIPWYCYYKNTTDPDTIQKFGALYNWYAMKSEKLAPPGWHVPTDADWDTLQDYLIANGYNYDGTTSANKIAKSMADKGGWRGDGYIEEGAIGYNQSTNNSSGFTARPGGYRKNGVSYFYMGSYGYWWCDMKSDPSLSCNRQLGYWDEYLDNDGYSKNYGYSIRLVRDN